jgi:hypothetical protein
MRSIGDLGLVTLWSGGAAFLVAAGLAYALATTALRGAGILAGGTLAVLAVTLAWASLASSSCDGCGILLLFFASLQVVGWLLGAVLGWGLRWVFRRR